MRPRLVVALGAVLATLVAAAILLRPQPALAPNPSYPRVGTVVLITIDTLRADAVGAYASDPARPSRTPTVDGLAATGVRFDRAYAPAPITLTSHATLLTGVLPPGHGGRHNGMVMGDGVSTLAEEFQVGRRRTGAFVTAFPLDRRFGLSRGFDIYSDRMPRDASGRLANERPGALAVDEAIAWVREAAHHPFFLWLHLFEPHAPYGDPADGRPARERYHDEVAEADHQIQRLLDGIGQVRDHALIVVTADHGEAFGEHGEVGHSLFVYDTTLRVPLIIAGPGLPAGYVVPDPVGLVDVAATIRRAAGLRDVEGDGVDLSPAWRGERLTRGPLYSESFAPLLDFGWSSLRSLRTGNWKYIDAPKPELYDLGLDPTETRNLVEREPAVASDLAARVARISSAELTANAGSTRVDPDAITRLRALGYASGSRQTSMAARRDPKDGRALAARLATIASGELRGDELESALEAVLQEDPANAQANLRLGHLRVEQGRCADAERLFVEAMRAELPGADAHLGLATCLGARGAVSEALKVLTEADAREPGNPVVVANLGIGLAATHRDDAAVEKLRAALAIDPDLHEARFHLARALARSGRRADAAREARELLERLPANAPQRTEVERLLRAVS